MSEMVERVAEALAGRQWTSMEDGNVYCSNPTKYHYREQARTAIEAMREPTSNQDGAFRGTLAWMSDTALGHQQRDAHVEDNRNRWRLMVDAALADETVIAKAEPTNIERGA